ncbi:hypothetical protein RvY_00444 [Ramazzottius varieornatus]|uniref:Uncharacterized protein n=1 Tax=Ramazzottius varieornatus TaxID=947166 RepID=A0A1D1UGV5_RAMVA|nr:hypothetical protein RvY_00444 [Ramazzottius varieornatus]
MKRTTTATEETRTQQEEIEMYRPSETGTNGQTRAAAQIDPGQTAILHAGGTTVSVTSAGGNAQLTAE